MTTFIFVYVGPIWRICLCGSILQAGAAERNAIVPFLVVVHPRFIYRKMSDVLSTAIRKQIYDLFGREIWCLGHHFGGRWRWTPTEGCIPIIGLVHEAGGRQQKRAHVRTSPLDCHEVSHGQIFELLDSTYPLIFKTYQKTRELIPVLGVNDFYQFLISDPRISIVDWWTELQRWPGGVVIEGGTSLVPKQRTRQIKMLPSTTVAVLV